MTERERFERFQANEIKMDYEELKRRLDQSEKITGQRYGRNGQFFREWLVWSAAAQQKEGFVLVPVEPNIHMIGAGMGGFVFPLDGGSFSKGEMVQAYKAMIAAAQEPT